MGRKAVWRLVALPRPTPMVVACALLWLSSAAGLAQPLPTADFDPIAVRRTLEKSLQDRLPADRGIALLREIKEALRELFVGMEYGGDDPLPPRYAEHHHVSNWVELRRSVVAYETVLFSVQILDLLPSGEAGAVATVLIAGQTEGAYFLQRKVFLLRHYPDGWTVTDFDQ